MKTLEDYYGWIDTLNVHAHHHVSSAIKKLQDELESQQEKDILAAELFAMDFMLNDGQIEGIFKRIAEDGTTVFEYPNPKEITPEMTDYLLERMGKTGNHSAKARYAQVVANTTGAATSGKAIRALIDGYIDFTNQLIATPFVAGERCYMIRSAIENMYPHSIKSSYSLNEVKELILTTTLTRGILSPTFRVSMMEFLFEQRKHFDRKDLEQCLLQAEEMYNTSDAAELRVMEELSRVAISLIRSVGGDMKIWNNRLAEAYEHSIDETESSGMGAMIDCQNAIQKYKLAKNEAKVHELSLRYTELRKKLKFTTVETNFNVTELNKHFNHFKAGIKKILPSHTDMDVIHFVVNEPVLFPQMELIKKRVQKGERNFLDYVTLYKADTNKNFTKKISEKEEHDLNKLHEQYHMDIEMFINQQLMLCFYYGYTHDKINYHSVIRFIQTHSWIGGNLTKTNSGGEAVTYNWLSVLSPALYELFNIFELRFKKMKAPVIPVLPLDSLTLKFEGLLRDFARLLGANTIVNAKGVIREMFIEELLETKEIQAKFNEDDRMLFRYVFVGRFGLNLRNQIAHCFLLPDQYTLEKTLLVLIAILRLGKYKIKTDNPVS